MEANKKTIMILLLSLFTIGMLSSVALFFSYVPVSYILLFFMFSGLISGLIYAEKHNNKSLRLGIYSSSAWLIVLLALSVAKIIRQYIVI